MPDAVRLSIVIPAFNEELYLGECLRHVLDEVSKAADCGPIEVLVVDNASTDRTSEIANGSPVSAWFTSPTRA